MTPSDDRKGTPPPASAEEATVAHGSVAVHRSPTPSDDTSGETRELDATAAAGCALYIKHEEARTLAEFEAHLNSRLLDTTSHR